MTTRDLIARVYAAFNARDIDGTLEFMSENVSWPKASEGGRVVGKQAIREYWTRQWSEFDPRVDVLDVIESESGETIVSVRQFVRNRNGDVVSDTEVRHVYRIVNGLIERMDIDEREGDPGGSSAAFSDRR